MAAIPEKTIVVTAERLYRVLLALYPKQFRQTYTQEMVQTFRDCCREALRDENT